MDCVGKSKGNFKMTDPDNKDINEIFKTRNLSSSLRVEPEIPVKAGTEFIHRVKIGFSEWVDIRFKAKRDSAIVGVEQVMDGWNMVLFKGHDIVKISQNGQQEESFQGRVFVFNSINLDALPGNLMETLRSRIFQA